MELQESTQSVSSMSVMTSFRGLVRSKFYENVESRGEEYDHVISCLTYMSRGSCQGWLMWQILVGRQLRHFGIYFLDRELWQEGQAMLRWLHCQVVFMLCLTVQNRLEKCYIWSKLGKNLVTYVIFICLFLFIFKRFFFFAFLPVICSIKDILLFYFFIKY